MNFEHIQHVVAVNFACYVSAPLYYANSDQMQLANVVHFTLLF